jgi:hypothetical protein
MHRRDLLKLTGAALAATALPPFALAGARRSPRLYFDPSHVGRIRANAQTPLLRPVFETWRANGVEALYATVDEAVASRNIVSDFGRAMRTLSDVAVLHLVEPTGERRDALRYAIGATVDLPAWDYFLDGDEVIGIQRASLANTRLLFAREVLGDELGDELDDRLLDAIAEKGCLPCYRTIVGMNYPETVEGWRLDAVHASLFEYDMTRWPEILGANNLRAIPTMGLGLGALALRGRDDRAGLWLDTAVSSAKRFLDFVSADGSYFEGLSYVDYSFRTLFAFLEAHERVEGTIDWASQANFEGVARFVLAMQAGRKEDGEPDIVNFSDASYSVFPCVPAWIARKTGSGLAQFAAERVSRPGFYLDFLWYEPERTAAAPPETLENARLDLDWVIARTGWEADDAVLAFRSGMPANHEHADRNSFLYKVHGERLLTDHFGAAYGWRDPKWLLRLTKAHNAVLIDGQGHQYHDGAEGTNEGLARARLIRYEPEGERVWWCSDATHGYRLVDDDVRRVRRTLAFIKPEDLAREGGVIVLLDQIEKAEAPSTAAVRFFPDNRDGAAALEADGGTFTVRRPRATLHGWTKARSDLRVTADRLDLPEEHGVYPFFEVSAEPARSHEIVTVLVARPKGGADVPEVSADVPEVSIKPEADGWTIAVGDLSLRIGAVDGGDLGDVPELTWG